MKGLRDSLLVEAKRRFDLMKDKGIIGTLSPTPIDFITKTVLGVQTADSSSTNNLDMSRQSIVVELGCGDGRWLKAIRDHFQCLCLGIEMDVGRIRLAADDKSKSQKVFVSPRAPLGPRLELITADILSIDLRLSTHLIFYLSVEGNKKIYEKIQAEVQRGTVILSCGFQMPDMIPVHVYRSHGLAAYKYIF